MKGGGNNVDGAPGYCRRPFRDSFLMVPLFGDRRKRRTVYTVHDPSLQMDFFRRYRIDLLPVPFQERQLQPRISWAGGQKTPEGET